MINLYYSEAYWGHSATMNGPHKVVDNLIKSLDQEKIDYAINEEKYEHNFLVQYDATAHEKHSKIEQDTTIIGPQRYVRDGIFMAAWHGTTARATKAEPRGESEPSRKIFYINYSCSGIAALTG